MAAPFPQKLTQDRSPVDPIYHFDFLFILNKHNYMQME